MPDRTAAEPRDLHPRRVVAGALIIWGSLILVAVAAALLLHLWRVPADAGPNRPLRTSPAEPALLSAPQVDRAAYEAEKAKLLNGYGWLDRRQGIARIPIDAAMDLVAAGNTRTGTATTRGER